ncbi:DUF190 domain-containing protein [Conexibacter sp. CPCC 206217]|uniref:DUF190 domain-containing protein n=1 Tax=Conexibacter sp. CPCC 206217 TaxID=3064574 RepID=UPI00271F8AF2|nr:DUF190 domain-containing protein [Conexibacter sp. CPCC 206217]MDO8212033.1 DUF190 domain-containing protein [Conexibacter sp. CPCC 206217]
MNVDCLKLTTYTSERRRIDGEFLADALIDLYARHRFQTSIMLRGTEGFGLRHHLRTQRLLTLSEDLPIVTIAVDTRPRIEAAVPELASMTEHGLVTLERARLLTGAIEPIRLPERLHDETKLTIWIGRRERAAGRPAFVTIVDLLRRHGVAGATVLLGVDGTTHGLRRRAAFFARNAEVPLMVVAIGSGTTIAAALPELAATLDRPLFAIERVRVCKRDGRRLAGLPEVAGRDAGGLNVWQKLTVYAGEQSRHDDGPLHVQLVRRLREAGLTGATAARGIWGYHGDHAPHGDTVLSIRRRVPIVTIVVDRPARIRRAFELVDELTDQTGLVTSELVPALRTGDGDRSLGGLGLAEP